MTVDIKNLKNAIRGLPTDHSEVQSSIGETIEAMKPEYERTNNPPSEKVRKTQVNLGWITGSINTAPQGNASQYIEGLNQAELEHQRLVSHLKKNG